MPPRTRSTLVLTAALLALSLPLTAGQAQQAQDHASALGSPRVDLLDDGRVVVSMDAAGDLPGVISFSLQPDGAGGYTGTWAFMVAAADNSDPATGVEPPAHAEDAPHADGEPHRDFLRLVHRGDLSGTVSHASFSYNDAGAVAFDATLAIARGGLEFAGVTGSGSVSLASLTLRF